MTITKKAFRSGLAVAALVCGGLLVGCGGSTADNTSDASSAADPVAEEQAQADAMETEQDLAAQQREMDEQRAALKAREAEVARREAATAKRSETTQAPVARGPRTPVPAEPVSRTVSLTLPASTTLEVEFAEGLSSEESVAGDPVRAFVVQDVVQDGTVAIPAGSEVRGQVVEARPVKKIGGQAKLALSFDTLRLPAGDEVAISSSIEFLGKKQTGKDAATIGGSAAGGALLGRVLGGDDKDKNTAIGAVVGAAVGTAVAANNKTDPVLVQTGQATQLLLHEPVRLTVVREAPASALASR